MKKKENINYNREKIINELKENLKGFTVSELSKKLEISRQTITNCFSFLEGADKVKTRQAGMAKIYFWNNNEKTKMKKIFLILTFILIPILAINLISASDDVLIWQGQYYTGTTLHSGSYEFNFTIYDDLTGGEICYSNTTTITTDSLGWWKTEQIGVNAACDNVSKDYYLNIKIDGNDQTPRKRLTMWNFLRKNVDENSSGTIETDILKARSGLKDLNKSTWQAKLDYAREFANSTLINQQIRAITLVNNSRNLSLAESGTNLEFKLRRIQLAGEDAKVLIESNRKIAIAKILEAKKLALLNGEVPADLAVIEAEATLKEAALNSTAQEFLNTLTSLINDSLATVTSADDGVRFCLSNGTNCNSIPTYNATYDGYNSTGLIQDWNANGYIKDWNASGYIMNWNATGLIQDWNSNGYIKDWNASGYIMNWNATGLIQDWSTTSFIESDPFWTSNFTLYNSSWSSTYNSTYHNYNSTGLIKDWNATFTESDPHWTSNSSTVARTGTCPAGRVVQNTTTGGVECMAINNNLIAETYLSTTVNTTSAAYTTLFTIHLVPTKTNIIHINLIQSSPINSVGIRNRVIVNATGPTGGCSFVTQNSITAQQTDNIVTTTASEDTAVGTSVGIGSPFMNRITCTEIADTTVKDLIIQFISETPTNVTTYQGSYYTHITN